MGSFREAILMANIIKAELNIIKEVLNIIMEEDIVKEEVKEGIMNMELVLINHTNPKLAIHIPN